MSTSDQSIRRSSRIAHVNALKAFGLTSAVPPSLPHGSNLGTGNTDDRLHRKGQKTRSIKHQTNRQPHRGKIMDMPLDVLYEIFEFLLPLDVLRLSRTSKPIRDVLMHRSSMFIWKSAFANWSVSTGCPPPPCPEDLIEPQWASLLFDDHCSICLKSGGSNVLWAFRVRCCKWCLTDPFGDFTPSLNIDPRLPSTANVLLSARVAENRTFYYRKSDGDDFAKEFEDAIDKGCCLDRRFKLVAKRQKHIKLYETWAKEVAEREKTLEMRKKAIFSKLTSLGWGKEIKIIVEMSYHTGLDPLSTHALVRKPKNLTDHAWVTIQPVLVQLLQEHKENRLRAERGPLMEERILIFRELVDKYRIKCQRDDRQILPPVADIYDTLDGLKAIIEADPEKNVTSRSFSKIMQKLPRLAEDWRKSKDLDLLSLLPGPHGEPAPPPGDTSQLNLAINTWTCKTCMQLMTYPRILAHACASELRVGIDDVEEGSHYRVLNSHPWRLGNFEFDDRTSRGACCILEECGLDSDTVTSADMEGVWVECMHPSCHRDNDTKMVMSYGSALSHYKMCHTCLDPADHPWSLLGPADTLVALQEMKKHPSFVHCSVCSEKVLDITVHLREQHKKTVRKAKEGTHYFLPIDEPPPQAILVHLRSRLSA